MIARGFIQIVPDRDSKGRARSLTIQRVTKSAPYNPLPGALLVQIELEIPDEVAHAQTAKAAISAGAITMVLEPEDDA